MNCDIQQERYEEAKRKRQQHVESVLASDSCKKIVLAGPGTGKTFLFREILKGKQNTLTLTFVNSLVEDLSLDLFGLSEVRTLHGFGRQQVAKATGKSVSVFPKLSAVIGQDSKILLGRNIDFDKLFHNKLDSDKNIEFYRARRVYYAHYGYTDMVYAAVRFFEENPDRIPVYSQILVDEFQDFNLLEVSLIELLASKSPILLAGDDDQALYKTLKSASAAHIRKRCGDGEPDYQYFTLPFCSRCTRVIVDATNDLISSAKKAGYLRDRIEKPFLYFDDPQKDYESERNPHLVYTQIYYKQIPWFIQERIKDIAEELRNKFTVLIISPTRAQCKKIAVALREKGFRNIHYVEKQQILELSLLEGLKLILENKTSNLGWRVVAKALLPDRKFEALLKKTVDTDNPVKFYDIIGQPVKKDVRNMIKILRAVRDGKTNETDTKLTNFLNRVAVDSIGIAAEELRDQVRSFSRKIIDPGLKNIFIKVTTIPSAKGQTADYVFITHFDDTYFIKDRNKTNISDQDICNIVVALTRARKKVFLISSDTNNKPTFLKWIESTRICSISNL